MIVNQPQQVVEWGPEVVLWGHSLLRALFSSTVLSVLMKTCFWLDGWERYSIKDLTLFCFLLSMWGALIGTQVYYYGIG